MFSSVNFKEYCESRQQFYNKLAFFKIEESDISNPICIDNLFLNTLTTNFQEEIEKRQNTSRFTKKENIAYKTKLLRVFPNLEEIFAYQGPSVYWFKIENSKVISNKQIIETYTTFRDKNKGWWTMVNPAKMNSTTNILYLGKVETALQNRFIQHLGLGHKYTTALKLQSWMPALSEMVIKFQFLKLDVGMKKYSEDIEKVLWDSSEPLLGSKPRF